MRNENESETGDTNAEEAEGQAYLTTGAGALPTDAERKFLQERPKK
jgi:hypothetical protein